MSDKNKYIILGIIFFPCLIGIYLGRFLAEAGNCIEESSDNFIDKFGKIIVEKLNWKQK